MFTGLCGNLKSYNDRLKALHANSQLYMQIKLLLNDLMVMGSSTSAQQRLMADPEAHHYISSVYFSPSDISMVLNFAGGTGLTLKQLLEVQISRKMESGRGGSSRDFEICTSHDLAPVFRDLFGVRKGFQQEKTFLKASKEFEKQWRKKSAKVSI